MLDAARECESCRMTSEPATKPATLASQVSRAVVWNTIFVPIRIIAEVVATLLKLTFLAPASYGLLALINSTNNAFGTAIDLGTGRALPKYIPETLQSGGPRAMRRLVLTVVGMQAALLALITLGFFLLKDTYLGDLRTKIAKVENLTDRAQLLSFVNDHGLLIIVAVLVLLLLGIGYDVLMAYLSSFFKQRAWNVVALAAGLLPPVLTSGAILLGWDIGGVLAASVLAPAIAVALVIWQVLRHQPELDTMPQPAESGPWLPTGFLRYCGVSFLMTVTDFLASAEFVVFFVETLIAVALIKAGISIVKMMLGYLYTPMVGVQVPLFTRVRAGQGGTLDGAYQSIVRLQVLLLIPGGVGLMLLAKPVFAALFPQYIESAYLVWVLVPCLFLECLLTTAHNVLIVYEELQIIVISRLLTLVSVPLVLVLEPQFDAVGAALAFGLARVLAGLWVTGSGVRRLGLRWPWQFTWRVLLASGLMVLPVVGLSLLLPALASNATIVDRLGEAALLGGIALAGLIVFLGVLRLTGGLDPQDREQLAKTSIPLKKWVLRVL
jgi:O-antigen/teichoic acid export membrane protein